jgi:hypothetical protein
MSAITVKDMDKQQYTIDYLLEANRIFTAIYNGDRVFGMKGDNNQVVWMDEDSVVHSTDIDGDEIKFFDVKYVTNAAIVVEVE